MTPGARVQAAADILDLWSSGDQALSRVMTGWGRANRYAGSGDRRAVADLVYDATRRLRSAAWIAGAGESPSGRDLMLGSLLLDDLDPAAFFTGVGHAPQPLTAAEATRLGQSPGGAPRPVRLDFPDWLAPHLAAVPDAALALMRRRAPLFLRANLLRGDRTAAIAALAAEQITAEPGPLSPTCLAVRSGVTQVVRSAAFREGLVEVQDAASQAAANYAQPAAGDVVLDYCAGAGGKALALAGAMGGRGDLHVHDIAPQRLAQFGERASRAGVAAVAHGPGQTGTLAGRCDLVFVDAPCSGSGAWRRNPDAKWRLTGDQLAEYLQTQDTVLEQACTAVRPRGRLVYATCSMLRAENEDRIASFLATHTQFQSGRPPLRLTPVDGGDGFFACELLRKPE